MLTAVMSNSPATPDAQHPPQLTPDVLVDEFKRQGHFDQVRKQILQDFQHSAHQEEFAQEAEAAMMHYIQDNPERLVYRDARLRHSDLMRELDRTPLLDQLVAKLSANQEGSDASSDPSALLGPEGRIAKQIRRQLVQMTRTVDPSGGSSTPKEAHVK